MSVRHQNIVTFQRFFLSEKNRKLLYQAYFCSENSDSSLEIRFSYPAVSDGVKEKLLSSTNQFQQVLNLFLLRKPSKMLQVASLGSLQGIFLQLASRSEINCCYLFSFSKVGLGLLFIMSFMNQQSPALTLLHNFSSGKKYCLTVIGG